MTGPRVAVVVLGALDVSLGAVLVVGDPVRTAAPAFMTAKVVAPLAVWGALIGLFGALLLAATALRTRLTPQHGRIALGFPAALAAGWHAFWAASFIATAVGDERAALTGIPAYAGLSALHLIVALIEE